MIFSAVSVICIAGLGLAEKLVLPVTTCKRDSSDYSTCLIHAIQEAWPRFMSGLPEFDFPPLDPFVYENGKNMFDSGDLRGEISVTNLTIRGLKKCRITDARAHLANDVFRLEIDYTIPRLYVHSYVEAEGRLGPFSLKGKGKFNATQTDLRGSYDLMGQVSNDTWTVERFIPQLSMRTFKISFDNFFDIAEMDDLAAGFINEYWPSLYRGMFPIMSRLWEPWSIDLVNRLFSKVSFSELFP